MNCLLPLMFLLFLSFQTTVLGGSSVFLNCERFYDVGGILRLRCIHDVRSACGNFSRLDDPFNEIDTLHFEHATGLSLEWLRCDKLHGVSKVEFRNTVVNCAVVKIKLKNCPNKVSSV